MPILDNLTSPDNGSTATHLVTFTIKVNGRQLPVEYGVVQINVENSINTLPTAQVLLEDGNAAEQSFDISSSDDLIPGNDLEINVGYSGDEHLIFKGLITRQRIRVNRAGGSYLQIEAKDPLFRLALNRKSRYFSEVTDSDLFEDVLNEYEGVSLDFGLPTGLNTYPEVVQYQVSDWDFLMMRAEKMGRYCTASEGNLKIQSLPPVGAPVFSVAYGRDLIDLDMEMDARYQVESVAASSWKEGDQNIQRETKEDTDVPNHGNISGADLGRISKSKIELNHGGNLSQEELDQWTQGQMLKSRLSKIKGTVKFQGNHQAKPGELIRLEGLGDRFNGTAFIAGVQHSVDRGRWLTIAQIGASPHWHYQKYDVFQYPTSGFTAPIHGLQIGVVTQLHDDPEGNERIKVKLPIVNANEEGTWARLLSSDAGDNRGFTWRPEVNDEVVVGFLNDDPNQAVIMGSLFSSARPAPFPAAEDNFEKGWVSREELKILLNDETKAIELQTPNGNKFLISDEEGGLILEDESGNKISFSSDGIRIESAGNLELKATGDVTVEGTNIELSADAEFKAEGSATAELSGGGQTNISGGIVNIN